MIRPKHPFDIRSDLRKAASFIRPNQLVRIRFEFGIFRFIVSFLFEKKIDKVYYSVFLLFSRCIDHFICYSRIVYIGDSLGHVICLLIYFRLAAMLLNILKCISI